MPRWVPVPLPQFADRYEVSDEGDVKRVGGGKGAVVGRILRSADNGKGYRTVMLRRPEACRRVAVHILVCKAFHGAAPKGHEVHHCNEKKSDNRAANLEWTTHAKNMRASAAKLSPRDVADIRRRRSQGEPRASIAAEYRIHVEHVSKVANGRAWA